jgi:hypothetical protein
VIVLWRTVLDRDLRRLVVAVGIVLVNDSMVMLVHGSRHIGAHVASRTGRHPDARGRGRADPRGEEQWEHDPADRPLPPAHFLEEIHRATLIDRRPRDSL